MIETKGKHMMIDPSQPGTVLKMHAKPGKGDALFELTNNLHYNGDPDGPVDWILCRADDDPDTLWAFEFYKDEESFKRHFSNPNLEKGHDQVIDLLSDMPMRVKVHPAFSSYQLKED